MMAHPMWRVTRHLSDRDRFRFANVPFPMLKRTPYPSLSKAIQDVSEALNSREICQQLAWRELCNQYDRTWLGLAWVVISPLLHILLLGGLFYTVLKQPPNYIAYFSASWILWMLVRQGLADGAHLWIRATPYVTNMRLPLSLFVFSTLMKNMMLSAMMLPMAFMACLLFSQSFVPGFLPLMIPGLLLFNLNLLWLLVITSICCLRFRDLAGLIPHGLFLLQFATPIFWPTERLGAHVWIATFNPFFHLLEIMRGPLIGTPPGPLSWTVALMTAIIGNAVAFTLFCVTRRRLVLWML